MHRSSDPKSVRVQLTAGSGLEIEWMDGHRSHYTFRFLRDACPCAECSTQRCREHRQPGDPQRLTLERMLPRLRPLPKAVEAEPMGRYGIRLGWDDGHSHGTYLWEFLRDVCPCPSCAGKSPPSAVSPVGVGTPVTTDPVQ